MTMRLMMTAALTWTLGGMLGCLVPPLPADGGADVVIPDAGTVSSSTSLVSSTSLASGTSASAGSGESSSSASAGSSTSAESSSSSARAALNEVCHATTDAGVINRDCQTGLLCCYPCGAAGCDYLCVAPCDGGNSCINGCAVMP